MHTTCQGDFGISDEYSVIAPPPVNRKCKRMSKPCYSNVEKWSEEDISAFIEVLHDDATKYAFNGSTINGPHWRKKINKVVNISKFKLNELNHYELLDEIFGKSIALGNHVVYSTMPVSQPTIDEPTEVEDDIFSCDDNPVNTESVYQPMSVNIDNDNGSGKWTMCDVSIPTDGITSSRRQKKYTYNNRRHIQ
ncbi:hypothetical protein RDI58_001450 [Solanum bulbocastanum]|uniref:Uncharacterized protein n=1 Tax=Solanum bulbocastanum TaxID=147425 RepID=A0AAN8UCP5_SOLBU